MDILVTYNISTLATTARGANYAAFEDWYNAICAKYGITPLPDPTDYFDGTANFAVFMSLHPDLAHTPMISALIEAYNNTKELYDIVTFITLAPTTTQLTYKVWQWLTKMSAVSTPTAAQLAAV